jgi:hypothetical protein
MNPLNFLVNIPDIVYLLANLSNMNKNMRKTYHIQETDLDRDLPQLIYVKQQKYLVIKDQVQKLLLIKKEDI